jgi:mycoredoxin
MTLPEQTSPIFTLYTTSWCGSCHRVKAFLAEKNYLSGKEYLEVDIDLDPHAATIVEQINDGNRSVPTFLFQDGTTLTEPSAYELERVFQELEVGD